MKYKKKPTLRGIVHAIGHKGIVFVVNYRLKVIQVRLDAATEAIDTIAFEYESDVDRLIAQWAQSHKSFCEQQNMRMKLRQVDIDRIATANAME